MLLSQELTLPCGLVVPNRLCKAAMAETMASTHVPDDKFLKCYGKWAEGGWGMVLTGNVMVSEVYMGSPRDIANTTIKSPELQEAWKSWARASQSNNTHCIVQLCHPGRQSPAGAGKRSFFSKTLAPSAVGIELGPSILEQLSAALLFGTPRAMTGDDIQEVVDEFTRAAKQCYDAGFKGVELHAAHGYLLAQFLSPKTNLRTDAYGGSAIARAKIIPEIIASIRAVTSPSFCIGIKLNSVDVDPSTPSSLADTMEQIQLLIEAGIDFIEISGGTYENPRMMAEPGENGATTGLKESTVARESFFLSFAAEVRARFPTVLLMVTGGFRTRIGMEAALQSSACDMIGIGRPAAVSPGLPKEIILNEAVQDEKASVVLEKLPVPWLAKVVPIKQIGAGWQSFYYAGQIQRMGNGLEPIDTRVKV